MSDAALRSDLILHLDHLLDVADLTGKALHTGTRLRQRLTSDICVLIAGPHEPATQHLHVALDRSAPTQTSLQIVPWGNEVDFSAADLCLWCTSQFGPQELAQWRDAPNRLKDHSFLVAVSDVHDSNAAQARATLDHLQTIADEEFYCLSPLGFDAQEAQFDTAAVATLASDVAERVRMGASADADHAQMFLKKYPVELPIASVVENPSHTTTPAQLASPSEGIKPDPFSAEAIFRETLGTLDNHLSALEPLRHTQNDDGFQAILSVCEETSQALADVVSQSAAQDASFLQIKDDILSAAEMILLMAMEGGVTPAGSAVATLVQIKRDMQLHLAACGSVFTTS